MQALDEMVRGLLARKGGATLEAGFVGECTSRRPVVSKKAVQFGSSSYTFIWSCLTVALV